MNQHTSRARSSSPLSSNNIPNKNASFGLVIHQFVSFFSSIGVAVFICSSNFIARGRENECNTEDSNNNLEYSFGEKFANRCSISLPICSF